MDSPLSSLSFTNTLSGKRNVLRPAARELKLMSDRNANQELDFFFPKSKHIASTLVDPFGKTCSTASPASSLAADMSMNMHIDESPALPTPRRTLFRSLSCTVETPLANKTIVSPLPESPSNDALTESYFFRQPASKYSITQDSPRVSSTIAYSFKPKASIALNTTKSEATRSSLSSSSFDSYLRPNVSRSRSSGNAPPFLRSRSSSSYSINKKKGTSGGQATRHLTYALSRTCSQSSNTTSLLESCLTDDTDDFELMSDHEDTFTMGKVADLPESSVELVEDAASIQRPNSDFGACNDNSLDDLFQASPIKPIDMLPKINKDIAFPSLKVRSPSPMAFAMQEDAEYDEQDTPVLRRTQSMFLNSTRLGLFKSQDLVCVTPKQSTKESERFISSHVEDLSLPCFAVKEDSLKRITQETLLGLLDGKFKDIFDKCIIIDCRFEYEYLGGHISTAVNLNTKQAIVDAFLSKPLTHRVALVFHCEHSAHRAPHLALHFRNTDRRMNSHRYPFLYYPEVYILHGGYKSFYENHKNRCDPINYVPMNDASHVMTCTKAMNNFKRNATFMRTKSYTFGQSVLASPDVNDSPTAMHSLSTLRRF
ncbi:protein tyrosine phosphatase (M phase inducer) Cdc25 [Schizosaccharomyces pombe]|uniref:M-phase inducer phosphatase n=1 Tax=Schizosaccharomyces pombe (strain 972 / ATCC 24843) TaxID=284812 RepID=MPIP_SCHPO|nr:M phase inducer phosphatase Cdc25 [Schizosaccharomyces pombe]P06652.2 RecName: Full=M-phase inducer phosphatase; AltName: Full=Mitosis initiation protein; AltName: Full=P80 [Schizosaccharomyces pombe 972h-]CAA90849.1 M phase inducer phosphatase Cdc25 [Schizosaccharomyces pombe]|eukprot:NP_001342797.1 M phase inducer phosphatase Cdc25 [Schizosaccharomyces pombe]